MFIVFNRAKIYSYIVALSMVVILFILTATLSTGIVGNAINTSSKVKELPIYNVDTKQNKIALTMNCAWNADDIDSILETLSKNKVSITFFVVGDWVEKYPEAVKKISDAGHEIGNHSNTHPHVNSLSYESNMEEIRICSERVERLIGKATTLYRAPYGEYNDTVVKASKGQNHVAIQWNLDTLDYTGLIGEQMWNRLDTKLSNGSIILMHNGTDHTADSLEMLIKNIKKKGYKIVKVSDLIYKDSYVIDSNGTQKIENE